jgi:hypothetical protein
VVEEVQEVLGRPQDLEDLAVVELVHWEAQELLQLLIQDLVVVEVEDLDVVQPVDQELYI